MKMEGTYKTHRLLKKKSLFVFTLFVVIVGFLLRQQREQANALRIALQHDVHTASDELSENTSQQIVQYMRKETDVEKAIGRSINDACGHLTPNVTFAEFEMINQHINSSSVALEWGPSKNSCIWANLVATLDSIDIESSDRSFVQMSNHNLHLINGGESTKDETPKLSGIHLLYYVHLPREIKKTFDAVFLNGFATPRCAFHVVPFLNHGAILIVHKWKSKGHNVNEDILRWFEVVKSVDDVAVLQLKST